MARNSDGSSGNNISLAGGILNTNNGPFTICFWFRSNDVSQSQKYLIEGYYTGHWAIIYNYVSNTIEYYQTTDANPRTNSGISVSDTDWHHVAYRKAASGASAWDKFLDGVKTQISASINFTTPNTTSFITFSATSNLNRLNGQLAEMIIILGALSDADIAALAQGFRGAHLSNIVGGATARIYWPLLGLHSPETEWANNYQNGTVNGTIVYSDDPPLIPLYRRWGADYLVLGPPTLTNFVFPMFRPG